MGRQGRKPDYHGRTGDVIRFVKSHPRWSYGRVAETFGVSRQAIAQLIVTEERRKGIRLHIRQRKTPHLDSCLACQRAVRKLQKDPAQLTADLYPASFRSKRGYHLAELKKAGALKGAILFASKRMLKAYRAWRNGKTAAYIERWYGYKNWHSALTKLEMECPSRGRHEKRDLRPNWQKDLEGQDIKRLIRFSIYGQARTEKGTIIPYHQSVHALNKRLAIQNAGVTLFKMRGIRPITLRVKRWEKVRRETQEAGQRQIGTIGKVQKKAIA